MLDETLPIGAHDLWRLVMGEPDFQSSVRELNKQRDSKTGRWHLTKGASTAANYFLKFSINIACEALASLH